MSIKNIAKSLLETSGYEIHRIPSQMPVGTDLYSDILRLAEAKKVKYIFDVGANVGKVCQKYHSLFPTANLYAFEPAKQIFPKLIENCRTIPSIQLFPLAVSDTSGQRTFYEYGSNLNNSFLIPSKEVDSHYTDKSLITPTATSEVTMVTLDQFCAKKKVEQIDILKLDIQGFELSALKGAEQLLTQSKIGLIHSEVFFKPLYDNQCYFFEQYAYLAKFGYQLFGIYNFYYRENEGLQLADALFMSPEIFRLRSRTA